MKAINYKNSYYEVTEERGNFYYGKDSKGKIKVFAKNDVEIIELDSLPKSKSYKTKKVSEKPVDPIQTWKDIALSVNDKWNQHTSWILAGQTFGKMNPMGNTFIESLLDAMFSKGHLTEKQAYYLAKFGVETNQLN